MKNEFDGKEYYDKIKEDALRVMRKVLEGLKKVDEKDQEGLNNASQDRTEQHSRSIV